MKSYFVDDVIEEESELFTDHNDSSKKKSLIISKILKSSEKKENIGSILMNCNLNNQNLNNIYFQKMSDSLRNSINTVKSFNNSSNNKNGSDNKSKKSRENCKSDIPKIGVIDFNKNSCGYTPEFREEKNFKPLRKASRSEIPDINNGLASVVDEIVLKLQEKTKNCNDSIKTKKKLLLDSFLKCNF